MQNYLHNFTKIYEKEIKLHKNINENDIRLLYGEYRKLMIMDVTDISTEAGRNIYAGNIKKYPHTEHFDDSVRFYYAYQEYIVYPYLNYKTREEMSNENVYYVKRYNQFLNLQNLNKVALVATLEKIDDKYFIIYYFNSSIIQDILTNNKTLHKQVFINILTSQKKEIVLKKSADELATIQRNTNININITNNNFYKNVSLLKDDVTLFNYQKKDIAWMKTIERDVAIQENIIDFDYSYIFPILDGNYILYNDNIFPISLINLQLRLSFFVFLNSSISYQHIKNLMGYLCTGN